MLLLGSRLAPRHEGHADDAEPVRADGVVATCTGVPTPAPTAGGGLGETDAAAAVRGLAVAAAATLFFL